MPLCLGVKLGDAVLVGHHVLTVTEISSTTVFLKLGRVQYAITTHGYTNLVDDIRIRRGLFPDYPRIDIDAPRQIPISLYRKDRQLNLQRRLLRLCELVVTGHQSQWKKVERLCAVSAQARRVLNAILTDPASPRFGADWESRFKYLVASPRQVQGGLPGLGSRH